METLRSRMTAISATAAVAVAAVMMSAASTSAASAQTLDGPSSSPHWSERSTEEYNSEQHELSRYLAEHGVPNTVEFDQEGRENVRFDETDPAAWSAVDTFYDTKYPPSTQEILDSNISAIALAAFMTGKGIAARVVENDGSLARVEYDETDTAALDAVSDFAWATAPLPQAEIDATNAEAVDLVNAITTAGGTATLNTDRHGLQSVDTNWEDQAVQEATMAFWDTHPGPMVG